MLAYRVTAANMPLIAVNNDGVEPEVEEVPTYFIIGKNFADIVTETAFMERYRVTMPVNEEMGRYLIAEK